MRALEDSDVYARTRLAPLAARRLATASPIPVFRGRGQSTSGREEVLVVCGRGEDKPREPPVTMASLFSYGRDNRFAMLGALIKYT